MAPKHKTQSEFKFDEYTEPELTACGNKFLESCKNAWDNRQHEQTLMVTKGKKTTRIAHERP